MVLMIDSLEVKAFDDLLKLMNRRKVVEFNSPRNEVFAPSVTSEKKF